MAVSAKTIQPHRSGYPLVQRTRPILRAFFLSVALSNGAVLALAQAPPATPASDSTLASRRVSDTAFTVPAAVGFVNDFANVLSPSRCCSPTALRSTSTHPSTWSLAREVEVAARRITSCCIGNARCPRSSSQFNPVRSTARCSDLAPAEAHSHCGCPFPIFAQRRQACRR